MIKTFNKYRTEIREKMRNGDGRVKIEHFWEPKTELKSNIRMFARLTLEPGASIGFHEHINEEEVFVVVRGTAEADDNGRKMILNAGDTILTGNSCHAIKNAGDDTLELIAVIATY